MKRYVQYGCGFTAPTEWINYDASPTLKFERVPLISKFYTRNSRRFPENVKYGDIVSGLPEKSGSCDGVYCSHVLEHLAYNDFVKALNNTYNLLKPGGVFRGVLPDLKSAVNDYVENYDLIESPAKMFMQNTLLGAEDRDKSVSAIIKYIHGNSKHLWMWDYRSLKFELEKAGFKNVRSCIFGDSGDSYFNFVEEEDRFFKAVAFECFK